MAPTQVQEWLGKSVTTTEHLSRDLLNRVSATLNHHPLGEGEPIPHLWQWCFFQPALPRDRLGRDGHPALGGFLPQAQNRNRMWAGGRVTFLKPLIVGAVAERKSTIAAIKEKEGSTCKLLFVTVSHVYSQLGEVCIKDEQDIVYREPPCLKRRVRLV